LVEQERAMTIRDLFTHMSGLPSFIAEDSPVEIMYKQAELTRSDRSLQEMAEALVELPLMSQPGSVWRYSHSTDVLAYLVELIGGTPLDLFLEQHIYRPLGMNDTGFYLPPEKHGRFAAAYGPVEHGNLVRLSTQSIIERYTVRGRYFSGAGGLVATAADYLQFARMLLGGGASDGMRLLSRKTVEMMTRNHLPPSLPSYRFNSERLAHLTRGYGFGLGVRVLMDVAESGVLGSEGEYGWSGAANTIVWIDPKEEMICLLLAQFMPLCHYPIDRQFKALAYQAIID
jgi:CubicO group peptidase (beta-lactamase class C family)